MEKKQRVFKPIVPKKKSKIRGRTRCTLPVILADKEMTQLECAERAELSPVTISALCSDKWTRVSKETITRLCHALNCKAGDLFEYIPEPSKEEQ